jgi:hypothetical protein
MIGSVLEQAAGHIGTLGTQEAKSGLVWRDFAVFVSLSSPDNRDQVSRLRDFVVEVTGL